MAMGATLYNFPSNTAITKKASPLGYQILKKPSCCLVHSRNQKLRKTLKMAHSSSTHSEQTPGNLHVWFWPGAPEEERIDSKHHNVVVGLKEKVSEKQHQRIIVQNNYGEKLVGVLHESGTMEIVVLCHGFRSTKESSTIASLAAALEKEGISVFSFDFAGNGESEGTFEYGNYQREADDLCAVIKHLNGMKRAVTAIVGHSKGGDVVLVYASKYHDINRVVNVSGRYNLERGIEDRLGKDFLEVIEKDGFIDVKTKGDSYRVTKESLMERLNTNMHEACLKIDNTCRVLTVHGSDDEVIPVEDAIEFDKIIPNHKLHIVEGANHSYTSHQAELASVVVPFIKDGVEHKDA